MRKMTILMSAMILLLSLVVITGCGDNATTDEATTDEAAKSAETVVATHDCDGGCGMTDMPADKTTEIEGKFYCAGCAKHMQEDSHEGHSH